MISSVIWTLTLLPNLPNFFTNVKTMPLWQKYKEKMKKKLKTDEKFSKKSLKKICLRKSVRPMAKFQYFANILILIVLQWIFWVIGHLGKFPIGSTLTSKAPLKTLYLFLYLSKGFFLYHLKAYLYSFILRCYSEFLGAPFMA